MSSPVRTRRRPGGASAPLWSGISRYPGHRDLDRHVVAAVGSSYGARVEADKSAHDAQIDAVVGLAVERGEHREPPARALGRI